MYQTILSSIKRKIEDTSYTSALITGIVNEGLLYVASHVFVPVLETFDDVDTVVDANVADLPSNFHRHLFSCHSADRNQPIKVENSRRNIDRHLSKLDQNGNVYRVARSGSSLYYQYQPTAAETLTIGYYRKPTNLSVTADGTPELPSGYERRLLVNYACWQIWSEKEQDDLKATNTQYHKKLFYEALNECKLEYPEPRAPSSVNDEMQWGYGYVA